MNNVANVLNQYFPDDCELIVLHRTKDCDLDEMCEHFEELALMLQKVAGPNMSKRTKDEVEVAQSLESLRLEICGYLTKLK
jgi:hypothetical protein